jgi:hypothetical protein
MFQITKLSKDSRDFISILSLTGKSKDLQTSLALARVIAFDLTLPTAPVDSINSFYISQHKLEVENIISTINEIILVDIKTVLDYVSKFYSLRYNICNGSKTVLAFNKETAIVDFFNISSSIDLVAINTISDNPVKMTELVNKFNILKQELKVSN